MFFFAWTKAKKQGKKEKQKKTRKEKGKKTRKEEKMKITRERESEKGKWDKLGRTEGRLKNQQKYTLSQGKTVFPQHKRKNKTKRKEGLGPSELALRSVFLFFVLFFVFLLLLLSSSLLTVCIFLGCIFIFSSHFHLSYSSDFCLLFVCCSFFSFCALCCRV